jgi:renalase
LRSSGGHCGLRLCPSPDAGERVATRQAGELPFDHGAPYAIIESDSFAAVLYSLMNAGDAASWNDGSSLTRFVGTPGMSSIPKALADGMDVRFGTQISAVRPDGTGRRLRHAETDYAPSHVVVTVPAPQVLGLLGHGHPLVAQITGVKMSPELTLMAAVSGDAPVARPTEQHVHLAMITRTAKWCHNMGRACRPVVDAGASG